MIMRKLAVAVSLFSFTACSATTAVPAVQAAPVSVAAPPADRSAAPTRGAAQAADREAIREVLRQLTEAQKNYDVAAMDRVLAPDYVEVSPDGALDERAKVLSFYTPERKNAAGMELTSYAISEMELRVFGDTAVAVALLPFTMVTPGSAPTTHAFRCTYVLLRSGGRWLVISSQATVIRQQPPETAPASNKR